MAKEKAEVSEETRQIHEKVKAFYGGEEEALHAQIWSTQAVVSITRQGVERGLTQEQAIVALVASAESIKDAVQLMVHVLGEEDPIAVIERGLVMLEAREAAAKGKVN